MLSREASPESADHDTLQLELPMLILCDLSREAVLGNANHDTCCTTWMQETRAMAHKMPWKNIVERQEAMGKHQLDQLRSKKEILGLSRNWLTACSSLLSACTFWNMPVTL